jgi:hypothetical protein
MHNNFPQEVTKKNRAPSAHLDSYFFLLVVFIEIGIFLFLTKGHRLVGGHDAFQCFAVQYGLMNNTVCCGEIPQWTPFMMHGTLATLGYLVLGGIVPNILLLSGSILKNVNFLPIYYVGFFFDELILLVGIWLLGKRLFLSPFTRCFVALSILGSCIWLIQPWFNFRIYYAIPLILYFLHLFLERGKWRYFFLAGNLLFIQSMGNLPYFLPLLSLVIFIYFCFYFVFNRKDVWREIRTIRFGWPCICTIFFILLLFYVFYLALTIGLDQILNYNFQRNFDWSTDLNPFLTYGGKSWSAWLELVLGISPCADYTLYIGIACIPFILLGTIFNINKSNVHFLLIIIVLSLFSMGTFVSTFLYFSWPTMKYYRHLMSVAPVIKVFLCFLAGFGFDAIFSDQGRWKQPLVIKATFAIISLLGVITAFFIWKIANDYGFSAQFVFSMVPKYLPYYKPLFKEDLMFLLFIRTALFALIFSVLFFVLLIFNRKKFLLFFSIVFLVLHFADIYGFKMTEIKLKSVPLEANLYKMTEFQPIPYPKRRDRGFWNNNPRAAIMKYLPFKEPGEFYWTTYVFLFKDQLGNSFRTDHWLLPLDIYMRAYWGQSIHDFSTKPKGLYYYSKLEFPMNHPAALKISGVTEDKIQFFAQAEVVNSEDRIVSKITDSEYKGDIIFLSPLEKNKVAGSTKQLNDSNEDLSADKRLYLSYTVKRFDSNNLVISTDTGNENSAWLFYSDVWHPLWTATVNGKETPVYKANLAYKAVKLKKGHNEVHFHFESKLMTFFHYVFGLNSLVWVLIILYLTGKIVFQPGTGFKKQPNRLSE